jgi:hypothetical protein
VLALSILIILALGVAVVSFFVEGTHWLLFASLGLVLLAFYLSRRPVRARPGSGDADSLGGAPVRRRLTVTIDDDIIGPESRERRYRSNESSDNADWDDRDDLTDRDDESGSAAAAGNFADGRAHVA